MPFRMVSDFVTASVELVCKQNFHNLYAYHPGGKNKFNFAGLGLIFEVKILFSAHPDQNYPHTLTLQFLFENWQKCKIAFIFQYFENLHTVHRPMQDPCK